MSSSSGQHRRPHRVPRSIGAIAVTAALAVGVLSPLAAAAAVEVPTPLLRYSFDGLPAQVPADYTVADSGSTSHPGTVINAGATGVTGPRGGSDTALRLPGGASTSAAAPYLRIAPGLVASGAVDLTLSAWINWSGKPECTWPFALGGSQTRHVFFTTSCGGNQYGGINNGGENRATATGPSPTNAWSHVAVVVDGGTSVSTFVNGVRVGTIATTRTAAAAVGTSTFSGYLGKSFYGADAYWAGAIDDVAVYGDALTGEQLVEAERPVSSSLAQRDAATSAGALDAVTGDLTLPRTGAAGSTITWTSSSPGVISATGVVNRPTFAQGNATVVLTPTATFGAVSVTGAPQTATVVAWPQGDGPEAALVRAVASALRASPTFTEPARGSLVLPEKGSDLTLASVRNPESATITWASSHPSVISAADTGVAPDVVKKGAVTRGDTARTVTLTATVSVPGTASASVQLPVQVPAATGLTADDYEAYLFAYFTADTIPGEKIRFATSDGNDALRWKNLNGAQPVIESTMGTMGLRDPFIMRSAEGDRFFLLATDLSVGRSGWGGATDRGSHYLEIWESTDLVNWSAQRHIEVNLPNAGMTWAPEAFYDPTISAYVVYFTASLYTDATRRTGDGNGPQILTTITRDFRTFGEPQPWFRAADVPGLIPDRGLIDSTILKDGETYYRFTKASQATGCASPDILAQKSTNLRATTASGAWTLIDQCIGRTAGTPEVEGPSAFLANPGDVNGHTYMLWVDNYGGVGYIPLMTNSLQGDIDWVYPRAFSLPASPRHGSVLPITREERDALAGKWAPNLLVSSVAPVSTEIEAGATTVALPPRVSATFADGHTESIAVTWDAVDVTRLTRPGDTVTVTGALSNSAATRATATVKVIGPELPLETTVSTRCLQGKVVLAVTSKNVGAQNVGVELTTAFGSKSATLAAGKSMSTTFTTRSASIGAGAVAVATHLPGDLTATGSASYAAVACN